MNLPLLRETGKEIKSGCYTASAAELGQKASVTKRCDASGDKDLISTRTVRVGHSPMPRVSWGLLFGTFLDGKCISISY